MTTTPSSPKLPEPSVESCITALVSALQHSKGWLHDYADAVVRDAIDRRHLEGGPAHRSLYELSGCIADVNTMLIGRYELRELQALEAEVAGLRESAARPSNAVLVPSSELRKLQEDAARWRAFEKALRYGLPGPGHKRQIRLVEVSPMYGDENEITDPRAAIDAARAAQEAKP
jgi:hypothetical protein